MIDIYINTRKMIKSSVDTLSHTPWQQHLIAESLKTPKNTSDNLVHCIIYNAGVKELQNVVEQISHNIGLNHYVSTEGLYVKEFAIHVHPGKPFYLVNMTESYPHEQLHYDFLHELSCGMVIDKRWVHKTRTFKPPRVWVLVECVSKYVRQRENFIFYRIINNQLVQINPFIVKNYPWVGDPNFELY